MLSGSIVKTNARTFPGVRKNGGGRRSGGNDPYVGAGVWCRWRYMMYALIEPVLANSFQKISEVRIGQRYPF